MKHLLLTSTVFALAACSGSQDNPQQSFFDGFETHCGKAYAGKLVSDNEADADFRGLPMVMHVRSCTDDEIRIPFHVGEDRSRTWVITKGDGTLTLKHDHRHEDGEEDSLTQYGGTTADTGTATRQTFPADQFSKDLFTREGIPVSNDNVWAMEVQTDELFAYELSRPNRFFRVEFDLSTPIDVPPAPWGFED